MVRLLRVLAYQLAWKVWIVYTQEMYVLLFLRVQASKSFKASWFPFIPLRKIFMERGHAHVHVFRNNIQIIGSGSQEGIEEHKTLFMNLT